MNYIINSDNKMYIVGLKALSKYNRLAYKYIIFEVLTSLREGTLIGSSTDGVTYKVSLPCDKKFKAVYGDVYLQYKVCEDNLLEMISVEPHNLFNELYRKYYDTVAGVPVIDEKSRFKLAMISRLGGK